MAVHGRARTIRVLVPEPGRRALDDDEFAGCEVWGTAVGSGGATGRYLAPPVASHTIKDACVRVEIAGSDPTAEAADHRGAIDSSWWSRSWPTCSTCSVRRAAKMANLTDERLDELVAIEKIGKRLDKNGLPAWAKEVEAGHANA